MASSVRAIVGLSFRSSCLSRINVPTVQSVRYRKPRWLPIAASKEFYVRKPTPIDPEEHEELESRYKHYRATVRGIRHYLRQELSKKTVTTKEKQELDEAAEFAWMEEEVKKWNQMLATSREQRQSEEERQEEERLQHVMQQKAEARLQRSLEAEKILQQNKASAVNFVTTENLEEEIEKMLDSRSDYNYAITKTGDILPGENPAVSEKRDQQTVKKANT
ncbi:28S ribosomal protein S26, mitochondrial [Aplysia californica]|uniref:Small ribosomal subunit protein mS26 n=1 Tax=Aplysia californica TaxID=6500 RepID=A0ABM0K1S0_APLCA|nr:28S ribosomal protein S26, mitochondrial [Aplysia californica]